MTHAFERVTLLIPAFNEEGGLATVLAKVAAHVPLGLDVLVVDDGSTDGTAAVAERARVRLVRHPANRGKGAAMRTGLATVDRPAVIVMDADDTYPADALPQIATLLREHSYVVGVREHGREHIPRLNRWGNLVVAAMVRLVAGNALKDPLTGLYGLDTGAMRSMDLVSDGFAVETEIAVKAGWMDLATVEIPIRYGARTGEAKLNPLRDGIAIAARLARLAWTGIGLGFLAMASASLGLCLLLAAYLAELPISPLPHPEPGDLRWAPLIIGGIGLLVVAAMLGGIDAVARERSRHRLHAGRRVGGAFAAALAGGVGIVVAASQSANLLDPSRGTPAPAMALIFGAAVTPALLPMFVGVLRRGQIHRDEDPRSPSRGELGVLACIVAAFAVVVVLGMLVRAPFSWDEAAYALTSRHWLLGTPDTGWGPHRPPALPILGMVALAVSSSETAFRIITLLLGMASLVAVWWLGRTLAGGAGGLVAAAVVATASPIQLDAGLFLNDVPSLGIVLVLLAFLWRTLERPGPLTPSFIWLAPLAAAAFYVRYGVIVILLAVGLTAALLWPRKLVAGWRWVLATIALFVILLVPHLVLAIHELGSPLGIMTAAAGAAAPGYVGQALLTYATWLPSRLIGPGPALVALIGIFAFGYWVARSVVLRSWSRHARAMTLLVVPALAQIAILGIGILPQYRYVFFAMTCLVIAGAITMAALWQTLSGMRWLITTAGVALLALGIGVTAVTMPALAASRSVVYSWIRTTGEQIAAESDGSCGVLASAVPQFTWYTGCATYDYGGIGATCVKPIGGVDRWLVVRRDGLFQAWPNAMAACVNRRTDGQATPLASSVGEVKADLYRLTDAMPRPDP